MRRSRLLARRSRRDTPAPCQRQAGPSDCTSARSRGSLHPAGQPSPDGRTSGGHRRPRRPALETCQLPTAARRERRGPVPGNLELLDSVTSILRGIESKGARRPPTSSAAQPVRGVHDRARSLQPRPLSLVARIAGVVTRRRDVRRIAATPKWIDVLIVTRWSPPVLTFAFLSTPVGARRCWTAGVHDGGFGMQVSDAQYARWRRGSERGAYFRRVDSGVRAGRHGHPGGRLLRGVQRRARGQASFKQCSPSSPQRRVGAVGCSSRALNYVRESMSDPANLGIFFPMLDEASPLAAFSAPSSSSRVVVRGTGDRLRVLYRRRSQPIVLSASRPLPALGRGRGGLPGRRGGA